MRNLTGALLALVRFMADLSAAFKGRYPRRYARKIVRRRVGRTLQRWGL